MFPHLYWYVVYCFYFWLHEWNPPPSIQSFSFISSSNLVHMVCLTTSTSDALGPAYFVRLPPNEGPLSLPASAAAGAWLAAILRHFWKEAGIRVPRSPSVYTHTAAGSNWVNEGESGGAMECGFSALHPRIPQHSHSSLVLLWTSEQFLSSRLFVSYRSKLPQH